MSPYPGPPPPHLVPEPPRLVVKLLLLPAQAQPLQPGVHTTSNLQPPGQARKEEERQQWQQQMSDHKAAGWCASITQGELLWTTIQMACGGKPTKDEGRRTNPHRTACLYAATTTYSQARYTTAPPL